MCIISNTKDIAGVFAANAFLAEYAAAQEHMARAATALLALRPYISAEQARKYDRTHKRMRAIIRDWNRIEHQREVK